MKNEIIIKGTYLPIEHVIVVGGKKTKDSLWGGGNLKDLPSDNQFDTLKQDGVTRRHECYVHLKVDFTNVLIKIILYKKKYYGFATISLYEARIITMTVRDPESAKSFIHIYNKSPQITTENIQGTIKISNAYPEDRKFHTVNQNPSAIATMLFKFQNFDHVNRFIKKTNWKNFEMLRYIKKREII